MKKLLLGAIQTGTTAERAHSNGSVWVVDFTGTYR